MRRWQKCQGHEPSDQFWLNQIRKTKRIKTSSFNLFWQSLLIKFIHFRWSSLRGQTRQAHEPWSLFTAEGSGEENRGVKHLRILFKFVNRRGGKLAGVMVSRATCRVVVALVMLFGMMETGESFTLPGNIHRWLIKKCRGKVNDVFIYSLQKW